jgi:hypothetical protein
VTFYNDNCFKVDASGAFWMLVNFKNSGASSLSFIAFLHGGAEVAKKKPKGRGIGTFVGLAATAGVFVLSTVVIYFVKRRQEVGACRSLPPWTAAWRLMHVSTATPRSQLSGGGRSLAHVANTRHHDDRNPTSLFMHASSQNQQC